jgi:hypothetical protein
MQYDKSAVFSEFPERAAIEVEKLNQLQRPWHLHGIGLLSLKTDREDLYSEFWQW